MSRLSLIWLIALLLQTYCNRHVLAQDISQIQPTIEKERQIVRIRNKILKELVNNGAKILRSETFNRVEQTSEDVTLDNEDINKDFKNEIKKGPVPSGTSKVMVTPGEPYPHSKDKCLAFHLEKYITNVDQIYPKKINLWIHLRKRGNKRNKKKKLDKAARAMSPEHQRNNDKNSLDKKKGRKKKNRKRRQGRRIKIFISDGKKTLVKMRMRITKTKWYKIELPISQFPDVISVNDSFKLCFKCKRCSKKVKMDLYRKGNDGARELKPGQAPEKNTDQPTIPFIHFEEPPRSQIYKRSIDVIKRSSDVINNKHRHGHAVRSRFSQNKNACCSEEIYREEISKVFPSILYPESINISLCLGNTDSLLDQPLLSQSNSSHRLLAGIQCEPHKYETFNFVYVNNQFKMRHASIQDLIPVGCSCRYIT